MKRLSLILSLAALAGLALPATSREAGGIWLDVPFVKQTRDGCGSAAISMLLQYWNAHGAPVAASRADATEIQKQLYSPKARGILASDMERYLRESGFRVFAFRGEWSDLERHLSQGRPLIASVKPGHAPLHYLVLVGLVREHDAVLVNDPARGKLLRFERADFEKEWRAADNWTLLAVPKNGE
jgi:ABC-type bacteriocin/lantibiotic exporter with double-glycine peptidase domain